MKEKIIKILMEKLKGEDRKTIYCSTCSGNGDGEVRCEWCHRKDMQWGISRKYAEQIADEILNEGMKE